MVPASSAAHDDADVHRCRCHLDEGGIRVTTFCRGVAATRAFPTKTTPCHPRLAVPLSPQIVTRSLAIIIVSVMVLMLAMFLLMLTESQPFDKIMFEQSSRLCHLSGLSTGITAP